MDVLRSAITASAPAKLNLYFEALAKRADGFHEIETLMATIDVRDALCFRPTTDGHISLACHWHLSVARGSSVARDAMPDERENLVYRAAGASR